MSRQCALTGKKTTSGQNRPFSLKATKRTFRPNLFWKRVFNPSTGRVERMRLSANAIRTLKKWAREIDAEFDAKQVIDTTDKITTTKDRVKKEKLTPKQKKEEAAKKEAKTNEVSKTEKVVEIKAEKEIADKKDVDKKTK
jgi:large subunit ribosomal protein L28